MSPASYRAAPPRGTRENITPRWATWQIRTYRPGVSRENIPVSNTFDDLDDGRPETPAQRADRNWNEILQELRVLQTGTQILTGFLLALAFQPSFADLDGGQRMLSWTATGLSC